MKSKKEIIKSLASHEKDVGSTVVQIGILSNKISNLSNHFKKFKKDKHSTLGLAKSVNRRKKLLSYPALLLVLKRQESSKTEF